MVELFFRFLNKAGTTTAAVAHYGDRERECVGWSRCGV